MRGVCSPSALNLELPDTSMACPPSCPYEQRGDLILYSHPMTRIRSHSFHLSWGEPTHGVYGIYSIHTSGPLLSNSDHTLYYRVVQGLSSSFFRPPLTHVTIRCLYPLHMAAPLQGLLFRCIRFLFNVCTTHQCVNPMNSIQYSHHLSPCFLNHPTYPLCTIVKGMSSTFCAFLRKTFTFFSEGSRIGRL